MKLVLLLLVAASLEFADVCSGDEAEKEWTLVLLTEAAKQVYLYIEYCCTKIYDYYSSLTREEPHPKFK